MQYMQDAAKGAGFAFIIFILLLSSFTVFVPLAGAQGETAFSVTLIAPTSNPVRRQYSAIITQSMQQVGIDSRLIYLSFPALIDRLWPGDEKLLGKPFEDGSFSISFIGWGQTSPIVEFKGQFTSEPGDLAPSGNNYYLYDNAEVNQLAKEYARALSFDAQVSVLKRLQAILYRDMPDLPIYYFAGVAAMDSALRPWGLKDFYRAVTFPDLQHWSGATELNYAEVGDVSNINPLQTSESNSFYALYIYGAIGASPQFIDARDFSFKLDAAESITSSEDGKTWTVKLRRGLQFHDGVEATADDAVYTYWLLLNPKIASVNFGTLIDKIGTKVSFKFLDGSTAVLDNTAKDQSPTSGSIEAVDKYTYRVTLHDIYFAAKDLIVGNVGGANGIQPKHLLEKIKPEDINSHPFATMRESYTYTWDTAKYGGSGRYTASGPVGIGPYKFEGYDFTKRLATLTKNRNYWNTTGLESAGQFTIEKYRVATIVEKESAIAAFNNKEVNVLDPNYSFQQDIQRLKDLGLSVATYDDLGWQELGFNMRHPIVGTGVDTPLGKSDPSRAAEAARHVRKAVSYLIPRQLIIDRLLNGLGTPATTFIGPYAGGRYDSALKADPYDPEAAKRELAAAGYRVEVGPIDITAPETGPAIISPTLSPEIKGLQISPVDLDAQYLFGASVRVSGTFANPVTGEPNRDFALVIQESVDPKAATDPAAAKWADVAVARTDAQGHYSVTVTPSQSGSVYYRAFFPGITVPPAQYPSVPSAAELKKLLETEAVPLVLPPSFSPASEIKTVTLGEFAKVLASAESIDRLAALTQTNLENLANSQNRLSDTMTSAQNSLSAQITSLQGQVSTLQGQVSGLTTGIYAAIALAIILGVAGIISGVRAGRKSRGG